MDTAVDTAVDTVADTAVDTAVDTVVDSVAVRWAVLACAPLLALVGPDGADAVPTKRWSFK